MHYCCVVPVAIPPSVIMCYMWHDSFYDSSYLVEGLRSNLPWIFIMRVGIAVKVFKVRGQRSASLVVNAQLKACSRETHSPSRASKSYGHNAFQIIHIHTTVINNGRAHTIQHCTHCGLWLWLQSCLMPQSPPPSPKWPKMCRVGL